MEDLVARSTVQRRFVMMLLAGFAAAAMLLAGLGIYGTMSQVGGAADRRDRSAHGAGRIARRGTAHGARGGRATDGGRRSWRDWLRAAALAWLMRAMLFEIAPLDPEAFGVAALVLCGFAFAACYLPARRASRVDPMVALRADAG